jgi:hypothetical protein
VDAGSKIGSDVADGIGDTPTNTMKNPAWILPGDALLPARSSLFLGPVHARSRRALMLRGGARFILGAAIVAGCAAQAAGSASASYEILPTALGAAAGRAMSSDYGSFSIIEGFVAGAATSPDYRAQYGFLSGSDLSEVTGRFVFYNESAWDGNDPAANAADDNAIATDKVALLPGGAATFASYTSYIRGLNGIMVDLPLSGAPLAEDFSFRLGNDGAPDGWSAAPAPGVIALRPGAGVGGADRVTLIWEGATAVRNRWLEVTVRATPRTGLATADVFYFGNAIGDSGNSAVNTQVDLVDELGARKNPHTFVNPAPIDDVYDYDRNQRVDLRDELIARNNPTTFVSALRLINLGAGDLAVFSDFHADAIAPDPVPRLALRTDGQNLWLETVGAVEHLPRLEAATDVTAGDWEEVDAEDIEAAGNARIRWLLAPRSGAQFFRIVLDPPSLSESFESLVEVREN